MILEKLKSQLGFTSSEREIAIYILNHPREFQIMTSEQLAKEARSSKSTVIRLCRKLGVSGYQEMKKILFAEQKENFELGDSTKLLKIEEMKTYTDYLDVVSNTYNGISSKMNRYLDHNILKRIINQLKKVDRIDFYASGLCHAVAEATAEKFGMLGIESVVYTALNEAFLVMNGNKRQSAAFVMSMSGNNPVSIHTAKQLQKYGVYVIGIAGYYGKELEKNCKETIYLLPRDGMEGTEQLMGVLSMHFIFDIIFLGLMTNGVQSDFAEKLKDMYRYDTNVSKKE